MAPGLGWPGRTALAVEVGVAETGDVSRETVQGTDQRTVEFEATATLDEATDGDLGDGELVPARISLVQSEELTDTAITSGPRNDGDAVETTPTVTAAEAVSRETSAEGTSTGARPDREWADDSAPAVVNIDDLPELADLETAEVNSEAIWGGSSPTQVRGGAPGGSAPAGRNDARKARLASAWADTPVRAVADRAMFGAGDPLVDGGQPTERQRTGPRSQVNQMVDTSGASDMAASVSDAMTGRDRVQPTTPGESAADGSGVSRETDTSGSGLGATRTGRVSRSAAHKELPKPPKTRVLTVANQKGGVGKTTTAVNIAAALGQAGLRVLVIDLDPQGNASTALGIDHHAEVASVYDVLVDGVPFDQVVQQCPDIPTLSCAPATIDLAGAEIELVSLVAREMRLARALTSFLDASAERGERYDYVLIDCPPSLGLLTINAFVAAAEVFIPIQCEYYALEGLSQLLKNIELIKAHLNPALHVSTILLTMYDGRTRLSAQVAAEVRKHFGASVIGTMVPRSVRISEAPSYGQTVITYDPGSSGALSYAAAAAELAEAAIREGVAR